MTNDKRIPVSVVIPMRNASTTVLETLKSITKQNYPILEIIIVDNVSRDNSKKIVEQYAKKSKIPIRLLEQKKDRGVSASFNRGVKEARSSLVVFLTSDASLPTNWELEKLVRPFCEETGVVASYSISLLPEYVWNTYNFWQKFHSCRDVNREIPLMVLKFDCIKRDVFLKIGGFDEINFGGDGAIGGEDAELSERLRKEGKIAPTEAKVIHLHYIGKDYNIFNMAKTRKMSARSYARFIKKSGINNPNASLTFLVRPLLGIIPFFPFMHIIGIVLLAFYSFFYTKKMFLTRSTITDPRIVLVPLLNICFLYYEIFWMLEAFFTTGKKT